MEENKQSGLSSITLAKNSRGYTYEIKFYSESNSNEDLITTFNRIQSCEKRMAEIYGKTEEDGKHNVKTVE